jgi:hypothetical protein
METATLLTLSLALGGIATGVGAIWTAVVTRRLARSTEQGISEQNERARITLEVDLMYRLEDRFTSPRFQSYQTRSLTHIKENYFVGDDDMLEPQDLDAAAVLMHDFFDEIGQLCRVGVLPVERVWSKYAGAAIGWVLWEPAIKKLREELNDPSIYEDYEYLYHQMVDLERQRGRMSARPTKEELRQFVEANLEFVAVGEKPTTSGGESTSGGE